MPTPPAAAALVLLVVSLAGCVGPVGPAPGGAPAGGLAVACDAPCVRPIDASPGRPWEPHVAVDPTDADHVVAASTLPEGASNDFWIWTHVTRDGGAAWAAQRLPGGLGAPPVHPLATYNAVGDPVVAFLPDGTLLFSGIATRRAAAGPAFGTTGFTLFVARSADGGVTFPEVAIVAEGRGAFTGIFGTPAGAVSRSVLFENQDKQWLAVGADGTVLLAWAEVRGGTPDALQGRCDLYFAASADGARSWTAPAVVEQGGCLSGAAPVIAPSGAWHIAHFDFGSGELSVATSRDEGASWATRPVGTTAFMPSLAVQPLPSGERLWLAYPGAGEEGQAVLVTFSDDGGATWAPALTLDAPEAPGSALPAIAADADGAFVVWYHNTGSGDERGSELRAATLRGNESSAVLVLDGAIEGPGDVMGHYIGLGARPGGAFAVWVTAAEGEFDLVGARVRRAEVAPTP